MKFGKIGKIFLHCEAYFHLLVNDFVVCFFSYIIIMYNCWYYQNKVFETLLKLTFFLIKMDYLYKV